MRSACVQRYETIQDALILTASEKGAMVGFCTGYPFRYEKSSLQDALLSTGHNPEEYFCYGESVLPTFLRNKGIGNEFYRRREEHAKKLGYNKICFFTITRQENDPKRPVGHIPLNTFWKAGVLLST